LGDGIEYGATTGERFGKFVYWLVTRYPEEKFSNVVVEEFLRSEFPRREKVKNKPFQSIGTHRGYARRCPERLGVKSDAEAAEVLARVDAAWATRCK
jgi:hypothetical protein